MDVAIVKYNAGNIYSVVNAMKRLGIEPVLTDDAEMLQKADRVLFPGQGQAREAGAEEAPSCDAPRRIISDWASGPQEMWGSFSRPRLKVPCSVPRRDYS